jgi:hypothetical protein
MERMEMVDEEKVMLVGAWPCSLKVSGVGVMRNDQSAMAMTSG